MDALWRIELLGGLRAVNADRVITRFRSRKTGALLAYLALHSQRSHPREELIEQLWPECDPRAGRLSLRVALSSLRHQLEPPGVAAGSVFMADISAVQLRPAAVTTDVARFEAAVQAGSRARSATERVRWLTEGVALYRGALLPGHFEAWILPEQQRLVELYFRALQQLVVSLEQQGDLERAVEYARQAVAADSQREELRDDLIRLPRGRRPRAAPRCHFQDASGTAPAAGAPAINGDSHPPPGPAEPAPLARGAVFPTVPNTSSCPPAGTVTFLTIGLPAAPGRCPPAEARSLARQPSCRVMVERLLECHGGHVVGDRTDVLIGAFQNTRDALLAAVAVQNGRADDATTVEDLRLALHMANLELREGRYPAEVLDQAGRLLRAARPGQILVAEEAAALLQREPPAGLQLLDLGLFRLEEKSPPERLFLVRSPGKDSRVSLAPEALPAAVCRLPLPLTRFFGRQEEIAWLCRALDREGPAPCRLVTLTGPGGIGKTRLALELAGRLREPWREAVWFVPLQDLTEPQRMADLLLETLRQPHSPYAAPLDQVVSHLSRQPSLLLLDNCEQLLPQGAGLVRVLLERVPALSVLITSRQRLNLVGEREFPLGPLPTPGDSSSSQPICGYPVDGVTKAGSSGPPGVDERRSTLLQNESVRLFVDRAQAVRPDFQVTETNAAAVRALCQKLEGLPLALELAAARAGVLTPAQMLARLQPRFELLTSRQRDLSSRHRSLRAALDWSYQLLSPELQRLFARLSIFRGGFTLAAAEAVCEDVGSWTLDIGTENQELQHDDPDRDEAASPIQNPKSKTQNALEGVEQLRECSLVVAEEGADGMRFRLLETLREYGAEQLSPEEQLALARRHADYFLALAEADLEPLAQVDGLVRMETEHDNLRAALDWALERAPELALRLAAALGRFWEEWRYLDEGRRRLTAVLERAGTARRSPAGAAVLAGASALALRQDDRQSAQTLLEESLAIRRELGDRAGMAATLADHAAHTLQRDEYSAARALYAESLDLYEELEDQAGIAMVLSGLGNVACYQGEDEAAHSLLTQSLAIRRRLGDRDGVALSLLHLGDFLLQQGDIPAAHACFEESLAIGRQQGHRGWVATVHGRLAIAAEQQGDYAEACRLMEKVLAQWRAIGHRIPIIHSLGGLGHLARRQGQYSEAKAFYRESLQLRRELGEIYVITQSLEDFAELAACEQQWSRLARLLGAARALREAIGKPLQPRDCVLYDELLSQARSSLGDVAVAAAAAEGQAMTREQAVSLALEEGNLL